MTFSQEQKDAGNAILRCRDGEVVAVQAVAGAGKTKLLVEANNRIEGRKLYTTFSKSLSLEAEELFDQKSTMVKTFHAYCRYAVIELGLGGNRQGKRSITTSFSFRNITDTISDDDRGLVVDMMKEYFSSEFISIHKFFRTKNLTEEIKNIVIFYIREMVNKNIPVTFGFIVKWYHILLYRGLYSPGYYDAIYIDEVQDFEPVGLEIFKLLPAKRKVIVGDHNQAIFSSFTYCTNGFDYLKESITKSLPLTRSYRVNIADAKLVQTFMRQHVDSEFIFKGHNHHDNTIHTVGYISRTNTSVIAKMIELDNRGVEYKLARKVGNLFSLVLNLIYMKKDGHITGEYSFLNHDVEVYYSDKKLQKSTTLFKYVWKTHSSNSAIKQACMLIATHGSRKLIDLHQQAKKRESSKKECSISVGTVFSYKGLTVDEAIIDKDLNLDYLNDKKLTAEEKHIENLIRYVAVSRHRIKLSNCDWLQNYKEDQNDR